MSLSESAQSLPVSLEIGVWSLAAGLLMLIFLWLLKIEPYVRRRNRTSTFFLYPWAPWKDCLDGFKVAQRHRRGIPSFLSIFWWGSLLEALGLILWLIAWSLHLS
jgi:hypothetical protein